MDPESYLKSYHIPSVYKTSPFPLSVALTTLHSHTPVLISVQSHARTLRIRRWHDHHRGPDADLRARARADGRENPWQGRRTRLLASQDVQHVRQAVGLFLGRAAVRRAHREEGCHRRAARARRASAHGTCFFSYLLTLVFFGFPS